MCYEAEGRKNLASLNKIRKDQHFDEKEKIDHFCGQSGHSLMKGKKLRKRDGALRGT